MEGCISCISTLNFRATVPIRGVRLVYVVCTSLERYLFFYFSFARLIYQKACNYIPFFWKGLVVTTACIDAVIFYLNDLCVAIDLAVIIP